MFSISESMGLEWILAFNRGGVPLGTPPHFEENNMCDKNNKHSGIERGGDNFAMIAGTLLDLLEQVKLREDAKEILTQFAVGVDLNSVARAYLDEQMKELFQSEEYSEVRKRITQYDALIQSEFGPPIVCCLEKRDNLLAEQFALQETHAFELAFQLASALMTLNN